MLCPQMQGLYSQAYISEGAPWWKRLFKPSMWTDLGRGEVRLHPRSRSSGGKDGGPRGPEERVSRAERALEPPVSIQNCSDKKAKIKCPVTNPKVKSSYCFLSLKTLFRMLRGYYMSTDPS